ncbi:MAG: autotransporter outer membrane beta-barrel domain-containing protein [Lactobacillales bacterium]|jgi:outer membrane autotransporter protein|nr:autotransporter outer membrane beta-barrel domain-containing protein [Lactobacillales bacterium]
MNQIRKKMLMTATALGLVVFLCASQAHAFVPVVDGGNSPVNNDTIGNGQLQDVINGGVTNNAEVQSGGKQELHTDGTSNATQLNGGVQNLYQNAVANGTIINSGSTQSLVNESVAYDTVVNSGGVQSVNERTAASYRTQVNDGGRQHILGTSYNTTVESGGQQNVEGISNDTVIKNGGLQTMSVTGASYGTVVEAGGKQDLTADYYEDGEVSHHVSSYNTILNGGLQTLTVAHENSSAIANGTIINGGGAQNVGTDAIANNTIINDGIQTVVGTANNTTINGGSQIVQKGALADTTIINSGGVQTVYGGKALNTTIEANGIQNVVDSYDEDVEIRGTVINGGTQNLSSWYPSGMNVSDYDAVINAGGIQNANANSQTFGTTINAGGTQNIKAGAVSNDSIVNADGIQNVAVGGVANRTVINSDGTQDLRGTADGTVINGTEGHTGKQYVLAGATATNTTIQGGFQHVEGTADDTVMTSGQQAALNGGVANRTTLYGKAGHEVFASSTLNDAQLYDNSVQLVWNGGTSNRTIVNDRAIQYVYTGGTSVDTTINAGANQYLYDQSTINGNQTVNGGNVYAVPASPVEILGTGTITFNGGTLSAIDPSVMPALGTNYGTITVHPTVTGQGNINIRGNETAAAAGTDYDQFAFDAISGTYNVDYLSSNSGADHPARIEDIILDNTGTKTAEFGLKGGGIDLGSYRYALENDNGAVSLYRTGYSGGAVTPMYLSAIALGSIAYLSDPMTKRVGELSLVENESDNDNRGWVNYINKDMTIADQDVHFQGVEFGYDYQIFKDAMNRVYVGILGLYSEADPNIKYRGEKVSESDIDAKGVGLYAIWTNKLGLFVDAVVREYWYDQKVKNTNNGNTNNYKLSQNATTLNIEAGQKVCLKGWETNGGTKVSAYMTPTAELAAVWMNGDSATTTGDGKVKIKSGSLYRTQLNVRAGLETRLSEKHLIDPYVTAGILYDAGGNAKATYNQTEFKKDISGFGYEVGAGINYRLTKMAHAYGEYRYQKGKEFDMNRFNIGLNFKF